jgi:hypothetical protein
VKWDERLVLIRRSHTLGSVMDRTKTDVDLEIAVPPLLLDVLTWHVETQLATPERRASDLLFPREDGGIRDDRILRKPFTATAKAMGSGKRVTRVPYVAPSRTSLARPRCATSSRDPSAATPPSRCNASTRR